MTQPAQDVAGAANLEKTYSPQQVELAITQKWTEAEIGACGPQSPLPPFCVMMPPPNVTGSLHLGHALTYTLQDVLIRYHRLQGKDVLWQPGTDHAGIATQMVVERQLAEEGLSRREMGREVFLERVWAWKAYSGDEIVHQMKCLGVSADWSRARFTMDEGMSHAVRQAFVKLYQEGLIYRDKRLVNWDPHFKTALSDLEVLHQETEATLWVLRYPIHEKPGVFIEIATTRPETMLGDAAVAVHPEDLRYQGLVGCHAVLPFVNRLIPIIADTYCDPDKGTGAVKITPAHDFNDFEVGKRHNLPMINIFDESARFNTSVPEAFQGLDRFEARRVLLERMKAEDIWVREEAIVTSVPYGDRSGVVVEPWLTDQWYLQAHVLAEEAIRAVEDGRIRFVPENLAQTYFEWMRNIQPWCISRQLWWGHQIPVWHGPDGAFFVAMSATEAQTQADTHYGKSVALVQDEDVLDTWFSSGLWPFSTLGWPDPTVEQDRYYPTDVLVTGFDIIFFWVARMVMMGLFFKKQVPFRTVYVHALVRDEKGQKMSKTKGNAINPLEMIETYGADALRFTLTALAAPSRDIRFGVAHVETYRNFMTKLWNATRFTLMKGCHWDEAFQPEAVHFSLNQWIITAVGDLLAQLPPFLESFRFHEASALLYHFVWGTYCDWYLELAKFSLEQGSPQEQQETRQTIAWALGCLLHALHPFVPFMTETLWGHVSQNKEALLSQRRWPTLQLSNPQSWSQAREEIIWVIAMMGYVRTLRSELRISPQVPLQICLFSETVPLQAFMERQGALLKKLLRLESLTLASEAPLVAKASGVSQGLVEKTLVTVSLQGLVDVEAEAARLEKAIQKAQKEKEALEQKLERPDFCEKAPESVIQEVKKRHAEALAQLAQLKASLGRFAF
ncbi:MAG: valine--tRNA ligase [Alphaproteobacteria bacterium]